MAEEEISSTRRHSDFPRQSVVTGPWGRRETLGGGRPIPRHTVVVEEGVDFAVGETALGSIKITPFISNTLRRLRQCVQKGNKVRRINPDEDHSWSEVSVGLVLATLDLCGLCTPHMQEELEWALIEKAAKNILTHVVFIFEHEKDRMSSHSAVFDGSAALQYMMQPSLVFLNDQMRKWLKHGSMNHRAMGQALSVVQQFDVILDSYVKLRKAGDASEAPFYLKTPNAIPEMSVDHVGEMVDPSAVYISGWWNNKKLQAFYVEIMHVSLSAISCSKFNNRYARVGSFLFNGALNLPKKQGTQAKRLVHAGKSMDVAKARAIWDLQSQPLINGFIEFMNDVVAVSRLFEIPFSELQLNNSNVQPNKKALNLAPIPQLPTAYLSQQPTVVVRIIYPYEGLDLRNLPPPPKSKHIDRMVPSPISNAKKSPAGKLYFKPPKPLVDHPDKPTALIIHYHGGGFIALDSFGHEVYLRKWSKQTGLPVLSVDYRWAPEHKYPIQLHECYETYVWARNNLDKLGVAPNAKIVLVGDSAGGNMVAAVTIRAINEGFQVPDGCLIMYPVAVNNARPSPSRLISLLDPLVSLPFMKVCQDSYTNETDDRIKDWHISPASAPPQVFAKFPTTHIHVGAYDPLLDDSVILSEKMAAAGNTCTLNIYDALGHGYLNMINDVPEVKLALVEAGDALRAMALGETK